MVVAFENHRVIEQFVVLIAGAEIESMNNLLLFSRMISKNTCDMIHQQNRFTVI